MAATTMVSYSYTPNILIPDNSSVGIADFQTVTTNIVDITSVTVVLGINGGFNGDFYVYLLHNSGFSVLLNRVGKTATNEFGYADSGINATFTAAAVNDVHNYRTVNNPLGAPLTGTWQPDARQSDPTVTLDTDARTATLASFSGLDANGTWVLYVADRSSGSIGTLANWSLTIEGNAIPEPSSALMLLGVSALCLRRRR
jgi:subtilisin-like proprotein convertase family protein